MSQLPPPQQHTASVWHPDVLERAHTAFVTLLTVDRMSNDKSGTWPNHRIHAFKAKALPSGSTNGRGFGSVFRHQSPGPGYSPGPFSCPKSPCGAGFWLPALRVAAIQNATIPAFSAPERSLFSVWPAGRRTLQSCKINHLPASVHCQPRRSVRHRTEPQRSAAPPSPLAAGFAGTTAGSCSGAAVRPGCSG